MTQIECHVCGKRLVPTVTGKYRKHNQKGQTEPCPTSGTVVPEEQDADSATSSTPSIPSTPATGATALPGASEYAENLNRIASNQAEEFRAEVGARLSQFSQPARDPDAGEQIRLFSQPAAFKAPKVDVRPMTDLGLEITARLKEMFHGYSNRQERSQQKALGPSEIGSPCDRRLAMSLMRLPRVNPGGDGWASFVGTCVHVGLAEMFTWADAGSGRYAVEVPLTFYSPFVPRGTADLLDRVLFMIDDHKLMGKWSRNKLKSSGPSPTYRVQAHTYAYGARKRGERIEHVAIIGWPRDESSLEDLYVWTEPYNPKVALDALARVDALAERLKGCTETLGLHNDGCSCPSDAEKAMALPFNNSDCRYCPFYMPGAQASGNGMCNGKS
ncbi:hypothetical protein C6N75_09680 [Streptomyces solincola]|uniref:Uncharacterized protein n=1 Tax=Streptomyces solincola TaxID=2100817 RepID=A0A2S9PY59_9ACTN|nr:hypothetical protein [Streptomyces solincola]PRH79345.1 hypothetical protein C6N75_09680 [Streptomyces solincola]